MTTKNGLFDQPPALEKTDGSMRRVGYELEFSGISLDAAATAVHSAIGGELEQTSAAERVVDAGALGSFKIELDWEFLKRKASKTSDEGGAEWVEHLSQAAAMFVPIEVVCPPIPVGELDVLVPLVVSLREAGAVGTEESLLAAYGVHINTEIPALDAETLFDYLRAFGLLQWWLAQAHEVDTTRKLSNYVGLYPEAYLKRVMSRSQPSMGDLFDDYLEHNATRNRALDLLPILAEIDADRVSAAVDDARIKARPAFHYRLPNCQIEKPKWSLATSWNFWCVVERLAGRRRDLDDLAGQFLAADRPIMGVSRNDWVSFIDQWLTDRALA